MLLKSHEPVHAMRIKSGIVVPEASIRACALKLGFGKVSNLSSRLDVVYRIQKLRLFITDLRYEKVQ